MSSESIRNRVKRLLKKHGLKGVNKPKRTPQHPKKSHIVLAKEGNKVKLIRYGQQGAKTAGKPKAGESDRMKKKRASFKARHRRNIKKGKMSAAYWANRSKWCLLFPILSLQAQSWLNVEFVSDQYAAESSWEILADTNVVASGVAGETLVNLPPGPYTFVAYDSFGDGICCEYGEGYIVLSNACGVDIEVLDFNTAQLDIPINLLPCPPPVLGCMDEQATNYNPEAIFEGEPCLYEVTFRLDLNGPHPEGIVTPEVNSDYFGWCGSCVPMEDANGDGVWEVTVSMAAGQYLWKFSADNWTYQELPVGVAESPCFIFDEFGYVNRPLNVQGPMALPPFCWESCLPCGAIPGCTNPEAINWNPWANFDQNCNILESADCDLTETEVMVVIVPDNYPGETGWSLVDVTNDEILAAVLAGEYAGEPTGIPIFSSVCAPIGSQLSFTISDVYGDGVNGAQWGGEDGGFGLLACGEEVYAMDPAQANFGYNFQHLFQAPACLEIEDIVGCGDPDYLEYNPNATVFLDLLCETPVVYGCIDSAYYNYDSLANVELQPDSCFYTLTLTDGAADGWFGSWLGVRQGEWLSPQYKMGPEDGLEESFELYLSSDEEVELYFFPTPQSMFTVAQCGFMLEGPTGDTLVNVPQWSIIPFPYTYKATTYCGNFCEEFAYGCLDTLAQNYDVYANSPDSSCYYAAGCMQAGYLEYYTQGYEADYDDGSCLTLAAFGCTDSTALNFDAGANVDNGSCIPVVVGCMDLSAYNYNAEANTEGDCLYDAGCATGPGVPYWLNDSCYAWVIEVDPYCCEAEWDGGCIGLYDYCQQGWPTGIPELADEVTIRPTVVEHKFYVDSPYPFVLTVFDATGREVLSSSRARQDASDWPVGTYHLVVVSDNRVFKQTIVKL